MPAPTAALCENSSHCSQSSASVPDQPARHEHSVLAAADCAPVLQGTQLLSDVWAYNIEYLPAPHDVHSLALVVDEYVPGLHGSHSARLDMPVPGK